MSSSDRGRGDAPGTRHDSLPASKTPAPVDSADPYPNWLDRMQRARARHAAITKNLYTWSNYKNWADRMRDSFDEDEGPPNGNGGGGNGTGGNGTGGNGNGNGHLGAKSPKR